MLSRGFMSDSIPNLIRKSENEANFHGNEPLFCFTCLRGSFVYHLLFPSRPEIHGLSISGRERKQCKHKKMVLTDLCIDYIIRILQDESNFM